jgi:hypothetical protein
MTSTSTTLERECRLSESDRKALVVEIAIAVVKMLWAERPVLTTPIGRYTGKQFAVILSAFDGGNPGDR